MKKVFDVLLGRLGYIRISVVKDTLNFAHSVAKRLDEHRETVEAIQEKTSLFDDFWHIGHMATQDDYLMRLYFLVHGFYPDPHDPNWPIHGEYVRPRPDILGRCGLPEFTQPESCIAKNTPGVVAGRHL